MRKAIYAYINKEIKNAKAGKKAYIILKINSLSDKELIKKLQEAAVAGVEVKAIIRSICCAAFEQKKVKIKPYAISIVDEYLEHARVMVFYNGGKPKTYILSADWMVRNLDHRIEVGCPIFNEVIKQELIDILTIQLADNTKARILDNNLSNSYVQATKSNKKIRSQIEIYNYLYQKKLSSPAHPRFAINGNVGKI